MLDSIKAFWAKPYNDDMNVTDWFLFYGLLVAIAMVWAMILGHIKGAMED